MDAIKTIHGLKIRKKPSKVVFRLSIWAKQKKKEAICFKKDFFQILDLNTTKSNRCYINCQVIICKIFFGEIHVYRVAKIAVEK